MLVVSSEAFNRSRTATIVAVTISSKPALAAAPRNVDLPAGTTGQRGNSVIDVSQIVTLHKRQVDDRVGVADREIMRRVETGLALVLDLSISRA